MAEGKDYLALVKVEPEDKVDHGIKGMKWGVRNSSGSSSTKKAGPGDSDFHNANISSIKKMQEDIRSGKLPSKTGTPDSERLSNLDSHIKSHEDALAKINGEKQVVGAASGETSSARYARLTALAKEGRASELSEQDLKFVNARTEALVKINKMNETDPGWLSKTAKKVVLNAAEKTMQSITNEIAGKYISGPIIEGLKGAKPEEKPKPKVEIPLPKHNPIGFAPPKKK